MRGFPVRRVAALALALPLAFLALWRGPSPAPSPARSAPAAPVAARPPQGAPAAASSGATKVDVEAPVDPRAAAVLTRGIAEAEKLTAAMADKWVPAPSPGRPAPRQAPRAPRLGKVELAAVERKFRAMPSDPEWIRSASRAVGAQRGRLGRAGIELASAECRREACRFELVLSGVRAETRRTRLSGESRTLGSGGSVVHTSFEPSGRVRNVIYLTRDGRPFLG